MFFWEEDFFYTFPFLSSIHSRAVFKFDGNSLGVTATGTDFAEFKGHYGNDERGFGYIRIKVRGNLTTATEQSKPIQCPFANW